ncbi:GNAT family N-acetyltransferase [Nocardia thraciensis]
MSLQQTVPDEVGRTPVVRIVALSGPIFDALTAGDLAAANALSPVPLTEYFTDPGWRRVWAWRGRQAREDPACTAWVTGAVVDVPRQLTVGMAGYHAPPDDTGTVEVGYAIDPAHRRRGYARAALEALLRRAGEDPRIRTVRASISPGNTASYRLASRYGLVEVGRQWDEEDGPEIIYEILGRRP